MAKKIRNLLSEIDKKFKESEEVSPDASCTLLGVFLIVFVLIYILFKGIGVINNLQGKLENAPSQSMKEKFEADMKKEIKKL